MKALEQQALDEYEKHLNQHNDQETKSGNGNHRNCLANADSSACLSNKKETCCQSDNCCGKDSGFPHTSGCTSTCSGDSCCKNTDETLGEAIKEGQESRAAKSNDSKSVYSEIERICKHFRDLVEKELNIALPVH